MPHSITQLKLKPHDIEFLDLLLAELSRPLGKADLAARVHALLAIFRPKYLNHVVENTLPDLECHLGLYKSDELGCFPVGDAIDYAGGIQHFREVFSLIREHQGSDFLLPDPLYNRQVRWIRFEGERIEVELLAQKPWHYSFFKSKQGENYYLEVVWHSSGASPSRIFKLEGAALAGFHSALDRNETEVLERLVEKYISRARKD